LTTLEPGCFNQSSYGDRFGLCSITSRLMRMAMLLKGILTFFLSIGACSDRS
jgi:hypothetical protein